MSVISRGELNAALRELLGLRGSVSLSLDETLLPVVIAGDLARAGPNSYAVPFYDHGEGAGNAAGHGAVLLRNPADSGVILTVEFMHGRASSAAARIDCYVGTVDRDWPEPAFDLASGTQTLLPSVIARKGTPAVQGSAPVIKFGAKTGPNFGGRLWNSVKSDDLQKDVLVAPAYWVLPPDSWIGARNHLAGATASLRLAFAGRIWPLG